MPENIQKLYGRTRRSDAGLWHNDELRFEHVQEALSRYDKEDYDYNDLVWHIKNAVIGDIFISEKVYEGIAKGEIWGNCIKIENNKTIRPVGEETRQYRIIKGIIERKTLRTDGVFDDTFLEIRKWTGVEAAGQALVFEHVIPGNIYIQELIRANVKNDFNEDYFRQFRKNISVCIVTSGQNKDLNAAFKNVMPGIKIPKTKRKETFPDDLWQKVLENRFARYDNLRDPVQIHERNQGPFVGQKIEIL